MLSLPTVAHEHHDILLAHVQELGAIADSIGRVSQAELDERLNAEYRFVTGQLVPHMERAEETLYPELERLLQNRHSMAPLRREHEELRRLIGELGDLRSHAPDLGAHLRLRRTLYRMYSILKVHLAEEEAYLAVLERNLSPEERGELAKAMEHATAERG
jgi:iron-sulfur cluster repair protein YtfE (RIC family)